MTMSLRIKSCFAIGVLWLTGVGKADEVVAVCPGYESFVVSGEIRAMCPASSEEGVRQCKENISKFTALADLDARKKFELAYLHLRMSRIAKDQAQRKDWSEHAKQAFEVLRQEYPHDPAVLYYLSFLVDESERIALYRKIISLAPGCSRITHYLTELLKDDQDERMYYITHGYDNASSSEWKIRFGGMQFRSRLQSNEFESARQVQHRVLRDVVAIKEGTTMNDMRPDYLLAVCSIDSFDLRFTEFCLVSIQSAIDDDIKRNRDLGDDVIRGIQILAYTLLDEPMDVFIPKSFWDQFAHPVEQSREILLEIPFFHYEAVRYATRLSDLVESIPLEFHTMELYEVAEGILGHNEKVAMLRGLLEKDPANTIIRAKLTRVYGRPIDL